MDDPWLRMHPNYEARMDPTMYDEWMRCVDKDYEPTGSSSSSHFRDETSEHESDWSSEGVERDVRVGGSSCSGSDGNLQFNRSISN